MKKIKTFTINNISHAYRTYSLSATTLAEKKKEPLACLYTLVVIIFIVSLKVVLVISYTGQSF